MRPKKIRLLRLHPRVWSIPIILLVILFIWTFHSQQNTLDRLAADMKSLSDERDRLKEDILRLQRKIDFSKTDEYIEREAHSTLKLIYPGEILFEEAPN